MSGTVMVPTELCDSCHGKLWKLKAEGIHGGEGETFKDYKMQKTNTAFSEGFCTKQQQFLLGRKMGRAISWLGAL